MLWTRGTRCWWSEQRAGTSRYSTSQTQLCLTKSVFDPSPRPYAVLKVWLIVELSMCLFPADGYFTVEVADENDCRVSER